MAGRYEPHGHGGLIHRRLLRPSKRRVPPLQVSECSGYIVSNMRGSTCGTFIRLRVGSTRSLLGQFRQEHVAGGRVGQEYRPRGRHRRRRDPRACFGEILHLDGSVHAWFARGPGGAGGL